MNCDFMPSWQHLGELVRTIQEPYGREFKLTDITIIHNPHELVRLLMQPALPFRVAYALNDVCFIQMQTEEENWIVVKGQNQFDAITSINLGSEGLLIYILCVLGATDDQCRHHQFMVSDTYFKGYQMLSDTYDLETLEPLSNHIQINH